MLEDMIPSLKIKDKDNKPDNQVNIPNNQDNKPKNH